MAFTHSFRNTGLTAMGGQAVLASLHSANPGTTGTNELTGGSYGRQSVTWGAASNSTIGTNAAMDFSVPGGSTVAWVGLWASGGTTFLGGIQLASSEVFASNGTYTVTSINITMTDA